VRACGWWHETRHLVYYRDVPSTGSSAAILERARKAFDLDRAPTMVELAAAAGVSMRQLYRLFGSRENLLRALDQDLPPGARERVLEAAFELLGQSGLADLSMDELAARADVSRATLYRLFPGKAALFRELIEAYSPWEPIARVLDQSENSTPEHVMPRVAQALAEALTDRSAVLLRMVFEMSRGDPDATEGVQRSMQRGLPDLIRYLSEQIAAGRLRQLHPVLAVQLLAGPIVTYELTRPLAALVEYTPSREQLVSQVVAAWLRAMAPEPGSGGQRKDAAA
jgi:AcrR family transcriptional regulator